MPRMQFSDIVSRVEEITNVTGRRNLVKDSIQMGFNIAVAADLPYLMTNGYITTVALYNTGTVTVVNGSADIVGDSTVWTSAMVGRKIRIDDAQAYYRIKTVTDATHITLETVYQGDSDTGLSYDLYKDEYRLAPDCDVYKVLRQIENGQALDSVEPTAFDMMIPTPNAYGHPFMEILSGSRLDTYETGTLSGTVGTTTLTGVGTGWTSVEGLGRCSRITIGTYVYTVKSVDSDTQITLYEKLVATVGAGSSYSILLNNLIVQLYNIPNVVENIYYRYQRIAYPLYNDIDIPDLPDNWHWILVTAGQVWAWSTKDKEESIRQQAMFDAQVRMMWKRIGAPVPSRIYPRYSQDISWFNPDKPLAPSSYGIPLRYK